MAHTMTHAHFGKHMRYEEARDHTVIDKGLQRRRYGGFHFGAALFGWLVSTGMGVILTGILAAAGGALAVTSFSRSQTLNTQAVATIGIVSGVLFLAMIAVSYYAGGYVAGRMSRFDGARQGMGVWIIGILFTAILAVIGATLGAKYNVLQQMNLPHIPIKQGSFTTGGLITSLAAVVVSLLAALGGGMSGEHYHRKVDASGTIEQTTR